MCGVAGFNLSPTSKVNARALSHELLSLIEYRGNHASGFGYSKDGDFAVFKNNVPGSQLPLTGMSRRAKSVILHTRFATQGPASINENNHPVMSPSGGIALVHNGVISNDFIIRKDFTERLPQVDTSVIPAIIERDGLGGLEELSGYAAIAWLDATDRKYGDVLHVARLESSPVAYTWLLDGSFVFCSTVLMLEMALSEMGLEHGHVFEMGEGQYFRVRNGVIMQYRDDLKMQDDWEAWARYSGATAGGHDSGVERYNSYGTPTGAVGSEVTSRATGSSFITTGADGEDWEFDSETQQWVKTYSSWEDDYRARTPLALEAPEVIDDPDDNQGFYIADLDDALEFFHNLDELEKHLAWLSQITFHDDVPFPNADNKLRWMNYVKDMGEITVSGGMESWFEDMALIDNHESAATYNLSYMREGIGTLLGLRGY